MSGTPSKIIQHTKKQENVSNSKEKDKSTDQSDTDKTMNRQGHESIPYTQEAKD